jgi:hypothetical protein
LRDDALQRLLQNRSSILGGNADGKQHMSQLFKDQLSFLKQKSDHAIE